MLRRVLALTFVLLPAACQAVTGSFSVGPERQDSGGVASDGGGTGDATMGSADAADAKTGPNDAGAVDGQPNDASPSCTCTPQPPTGWTLVALSTSQASCAGAWTGSSSTTYDGLDAGAPTCGCTCAPSGAGCVVTFSWDQNCTCGCEGCCSGNTVLFLPANGCAPATVQASSDMSVSAPYYDAGASPSCTPQLTTSLPPTSWARTVTSCSPTLPIGQGTCGAGDQCVPAAPAGFAVCVEQAGDLTCPFGTKQLEYGGVNDTRGCSSCTCNGPTGFACGGSTVVYTANDCSGASSPLQCGPAGNSVQFVASPGGTCGASSVSATGSATPTGPVTFCCL